MPTSRQSRWTTARAPRAGDCRRIPRDARAGEIAIGGPRVGPAGLAEFTRKGKNGAFTAMADSKLLLNAGAPIAGHGPLVMNTSAEIQKAIIDFRNGRMGAPA